MPNIANASAELINANTHGKHHTPYVPVLSSARELIAKTPIVLSGFKADVDGSGGLGCRGILESRISSS